MRTSKNRKAPKRQTYYDTIAVAASVMGVSADILRSAKSAGAPGFRHGRVYPEELLPYLKEKGDGGIPLDKKSWEVNKLKLQCEGIETRNRMERAELVERDAYISWLGKVGATIKATLRQKLECELPGLIPGLAPEQRAYAKAFLKSSLDGALSELQREIRGIDESAVL